MANTLGISRKYLKFFVENVNERYIILVGGRRSAKTWSTFRWLHLLASGRPVTVMVAAASNSQLLATIQDFQECLGFAVQGSIIYGHHFRMSNGSLFQFKSFDEYTKCVGQKADYMFLNEAINLDEKSFTTLVQGITKQIILNYNPTTKGTWIEKFTAKDGHNRLRTTWKDNPYLTPEMVGEFESLKERAMKPTATPFDLYAYKVFYLGEDADMGGKVFPLVYTCTDDEYSKLDEKECFAIDFGFQESRDQTAMAGVKIHNNCLYAKEYIYDNVECQKDINLARRLLDLGINEYVPLVADYGGNGRARIHNLITACDGEWTEEGISHGFNCFSVNKGSSIIEGLKKMTNFDKIIVTESSYNLREELANYEIKPDGKPVEKYANHLCDCVRYGVQSYHLI